MNQLLKYISGKTLKAKYYFLKHISAIVVYIWKFHSFISVQEWISEVTQRNPSFKGAVEAVRDFMIYGK